MSLGNLCKKILVPCVVLILTGCNANGINNFSLRTIKNETMGREEKYGSIKIAEDEESDYFFEIKIPEGYEEATTQLGTFLTLYRFSTGESNQYTRAGILVSKTNSSQANDLKYYAKWIDQTYSADKGQPIFKDYDFGQEFGSNRYRVKTHILKYIFPCSYMKKGAICFSGQKEVVIIKIFKLNGIIWTVQYLNLINRVGSDNYEDLVKEKFAEGEKIIADCCRVVEVKKNGK